MAIGTAAAIPGTLVNLAAGGGEREAVRLVIHQALYVLVLKSEFINGKWAVKKQS